MDLTVAWQIYSKLALKPIFSLMNPYRSDDEWRPQNSFSHLYSLSVEKKSQVNQNQNLVLK